MIRKTTKDLLVESFKELAYKKSIHKITIKDITDNCEMAPSTFYRHFHNKYELITWDYGKRMEEIMKKAIEEEKSWSYLQLDYIHFYLKHKKFFVNILKDSRGYESFICNMSKIGAKQIENYLSHINNDNLKIYIEIYCHSAILLVCEWLFDNIEYTPEEIAIILDNCLPLPLREIIERF